MTKPRPFIHGRPQVEYLTPPHLFNGTLVTGKGLDGFSPLLRGSDVRSLCDDEADSSDYE